MEILNILVILVIASFGILGFNRGLTKQIAIFVGTLIVLFLAFEFKDLVGDILLLNCPFINFFNGVTALNIIFYQLLAFLIIVIILEIILNIIIAVTNLFEKILKYTIVFGIPSKILGMIVGFIEGYIVAFVIVFIVSSPYFDDRFGIKRTEFTDKILESSPVLSSYTEDAIDIINEVYTLKDNTDKDSVNLKVIDMSLERKVVRLSMIDELVSKEKLKINNIESVLEKYR